jgi:hypothetical protein
VVVANVLAPPITAEPAKLSVVPVALEKSKPLNEPFEPLTLVPKKFVVVIFVAITLVPVALTHVTPPKLLELDPPTIEPLK